MKDNLNELYDSLEKEASNVTVFSAEETQAFHDRINKQMNVANREFKEMHARSQIEAAKTILST